VKFKVQLMDLLVISSTSVLIIRFILATVMAVISKVIQQLV